MKRKTYIGTASAVVAALVLTLNITGAAQKTINANAAVQAANSVKSSQSTAVLYNSAKTANKPQVKVNVNLAVEKGDQKNADKGSSPWKLDPVYVSQVFASLKVSPKGIQGDYPVKYKELKLVKISKLDAIVGVSSSKTSIKRIYLKRLVRQDSKGIWTVVGYDNK